MVITLDPANPRHDFSVDYESHDIFVAPRTALKAFPAKKQRTEAARKGGLVIFPLAEDAAFNGRVILGPLDEEEQAEWITKSTAHIHIPDGAFVIDNGPYVTAKSEREGDLGESFQCFQVPPGNYTLTIYAMLNSVNGGDRLRLPSTDGYLAYWNQSRPGKRVPNWLLELADENDEEIPEDTPELELNPDRLIDFLFQLAPATEGGHGNDLRPDGSLAWEARRPDLCPRSIQSTSLAKYRTLKRKTLLERAREEENRASAQRKVVENQKAALKQERTAVFTRLANAAEAFRSKNWDGIQPLMTDGIRDQFIPFVEKQLDRLSAEGKQLDPIHPLVEGVFPTRNTDLETWQLDDGFSPPSLLDYEAVINSNQFIDIVWNFRDPENTNVFDQNHRLMVVLLVLYQEDTAHIAGVTIE